MKNTITVNNGLVVIVELIKVDNRNQRQGRLVVNGNQSNGLPTYSDLVVVKEGHHHLIKKTLIKLIVRLNVVVTQTVKRSKARSENRLVGDIVLPLRLQE